MCEKPVRQSQEEYAATWKQDFFSQPILARRGVAWDYGEPCEKTSRLMLTAPSLAYVDIRFSTESQSCLDWHSDPSRCRVFAGITSITFNSETGPCPIPYLAHFTWFRDIDSVDGVSSDESDMYLLPDGNWMEVGLLRDTQGQVQMYKEYWVDPISESTTDRRVASRSVVAKVADDQPGRGIIIRVGVYCQGVLSVGSDSKAGLFAERWIKSNSEFPTWAIDPRSVTASGVATSSPLPCSWVCDDTRKLGDEIFIDERKWVIVE